MKVFISWSGSKSQHVAIALRDWLPGVINSIEPFVSAKDIYAGTRWQSEIAAQLDQTNFGIVCVTRDNQSAPWLNFEAGALAKAVDVSRVIPLAVDLKPSDVEAPLGQFQSQPATEDGMKAILVSLNGALGEAQLPTPLLDTAFEVWWPRLQAQLVRIEQMTSTESFPPRTDRELLEETVDTVRHLARAVDRLGGPSPGLERAEAEQEKLVRAAVELIFAILRGEGLEKGSRIRRSQDRVFEVRTEEPLPGSIEKRIRAQIAPFDYQVKFTVEDTRRSTPPPEPESLSDGS